MASKIKILLRYCGFYPEQLIGNLKGLGFWNKDRRTMTEMMKMQKNTDFILTVRPQLLDKDDCAGVMKGAYFNQDLLIAQKIHKNNPERHIDIGSSIGGFVAHVASFREIEVFDIRTIDSIFKNIEFKQKDAMIFDTDLANSCDSISSLHAIEHFGLGRYGDTIDPNGHLVALDNIFKYLKKDGVFYFSVPISDKQRIEFNAHRIFSLSYLLNLFDGKYTLKTFSYVDDEGDLHRDIALSDADIKTTFHLDHGCGIFELIKK